MAAQIRPTAQGQFQSTHPVRGGTDTYSFSDNYAEISIHPPREGWDNRPKSCKFPSFTFQSTHPVRGGTSGCRARTHASSISIHPPREGWDGLSSPGLLSFGLDFNPPTP